MLFSRYFNSEFVEKVYLDGNPLPWVNSAKHLGNLITTDINYQFMSPDSKKDIRQKRGIFFNKFHQVLQQFGQYHPQLVIRLVSVYATALYGSCLWSLTSEDFEKLCKAWNTAVKLVWDLPHGTHTRYLESLSEIPHLESTLEGRFVGFLDGLVKSSKYVIGLILSQSATNISTLTGNNIAHLLSKHSLRTIGELCANKRQIKNMRRTKIDVDDEWRINFIEEMSLAKKGMIEIDFDRDDLEIILKDVSLT